MLRDFMSLPMNNYQEMRAIICIYSIIAVFGGGYLAERQGFEPWEPEGSTVFETAPFDHSGTSPRSETGRFSGAITKVGSGRAQEGKCTIHIGARIMAFGVDIFAQLKDNARLLQEEIPVAYLCNCPERGTQSEVQMICETPLCGTTRRE